MLQDSDDQVQAMDFFLVKIDKNSAKYQNDLRDGTRDLFYYFNHQTEQSLVVVIQLIDLKLSLSDDVLVLV